MSDHKCIQVNKTFNVVIDGRDQQVELVVHTYPEIDRHYFVSALTDTGFDLCGHERYFKYSQPIVNTRLRSDLSIATDMLAFLDDYENAVIQHAPRIVLTERVVTGRISGTNCMIQGVSGLEYFCAASIYSKQSGECISWYEHDVFKQGPIELLVYRNEEGRLRVKADEQALYDFDKLKALHDGERFQKSKYAFMFYNEVRRLLGIEVKGDPKRMSGLMDIGRQE